MSIEIVSGLSRIAADYDGLICDVWGVVHDGARPYHGAAEALSRFRAERGPVVLLSNAPRPNPDVARHLAHLGVPEAWDRIVTSGDVTRAELAERAPLKLFHLGPPRDLGLLDGLAVERTELDQAALVLCSGLFDDETEGPDDYAGLLGRARARDLPMICANPDLRVQRGDRVIYCAGAVAAAYERLGGRVLYAGKPHAPAFARAHAALEAAAGRKIASGRILVAGDGLATDIKGAGLAGLDALLVTGGIHASDFGESAAAPDPARVRSALAAAGVSARAALPRLVW